MHRGTNMNCVATTRVVTLPSGATRVPRFCSANSPARCNAFGSMCSTLLGGLIFIVSAVKTMVTRTAAIRTPTPKAHRSSVMRTRRSCISEGESVIASPHGPARDKHQQIDREISKDEQRDGSAGQQTGPERHDAHHLGE